MGLDVTRVELGPFAENCYVVRRPGGDEGVILDPGAPGEDDRILGALGGARCAAVLVTHADVDHLGGVADIAEATGAPVHMAARDRERLERINDFVPKAFGVTLRPHTPDVLLAGDETLELAGITWETLRVPGHTAGHLAYHADGCLFAGDLIFAGSVGRTDRPGDDWDSLLASIRMLVERFPPETAVYPGHGPSTTLGAELAGNPFLAELRTAHR
ncbi:MAG TPA: MBL fold metallo-hydrolase [Gaiellaceae bacterium]|nr:MBL fold metallo-hydrolase [Gaiellaceae bacterium]